MAYDAQQGMLVVSKSSDNRLLPGNGITKVMGNGYTGGGGREGQI